MDTEEKSESYNLLIASVREAVNDTVHLKLDSNYTSDELQELSKPELIAIILKQQQEQKHTEFEFETNTGSHKKKKVNQIKSSLMSPTSAKDAIYPETKSRMKATERMGTDYGKIEKQREKIKALKEKKRLEKLQNENMLKQRNMHRKFTHNPHEKMRAVRKATEKMATDYEKIEKQREKIRALKEKNKLEKKNNPNSLKLRNKHRTNHLFSNPHEKVIKHKEIKQVKVKKKSNNNKDKVVDPVSKEIIAQREDMKEGCEHIPHENEDINDESVTLTDDEINYDENIENVNVGSDSDIDEDGENE